MRPSPILFSGRATTSRLNRGELTYRALVMLNAPVLLGFSHAKGCGFVDTSRVTTDDEGSDFGRWIRIAAE